VVDVVEIGGGEEEFGRDADPGVGTGLAGGTETSAGLGTVVGL